MNHTVCISDLVKENLWAIITYIAFHLHSPENAASQLDQLEKKIYSHEVTLERYQKFEEEPWRFRGVRRFSVDRHCAFYMPYMASKLAISFVYCTQGTIWIAS